MLRMAQITYNPPDTRPQFNSTPNAFPEMYASETNLTIANEGASSIKARRFPTIQASEGVKNMSVASNPRMSTITANGSDAEMQANANYLNGTHTVSHHGPKNNVAHGHGNPVHGPNMHVAHGTFYSIQYDTISLGDTLCNESTI